MLFDDQYSLYKAFKSKKLLIAFVEFMFEDIEPENLNEKEQSVFNSLRERMINSKQKHDGNSKGWRNSCWWWRKWNVSSNQQTINKSKTTQKQVKNNEEEVEEEVIKENKEKKWYGEFGMCYLTDSEYSKIVSDYWLKNWEHLIKQVDTYCASKWKRYKNYAAAIRQFADRAWIKKITNQTVNESWVYDLPF